MEAERLGRKLLKLSSERSWGIGIRDKGAAPTPRGVALWEIIPNLKIWDQQQYPVYAVIETKIQGGSVYKVHSIQSTGVCGIILCNSALCLT